ncbi:D(1) dopamine receptor-like [Saccoglossus kowalevskii]|uniref:D(1)-like dopamine receptor-like n=1 Tax=Saccoglossus kowalevskii TaxID=10224 RepID=A0A1L7H7D8_SACKO|nr:PREDICTED: D(1)-like dopamine receptor-like [Saccoglossus kowalevskii]APU50765.1 dopamine receptor D(1)-like protein 242 [Saccoglossus kowalevskii]
MANASINTTSAMSLLTAAMTTSETPYQIVGFTTQMTHTKLREVTMTTDAFWSSTSPTLILSTLPPPDVVKNIIIGLVLAFIVLFTVLGNALVILSVFVYRRLRTNITNWFIVSLAISDLLVAILVMSWAAVNLVAGYWPFGEFCQVHITLDIMLSTASILNLCVISVDRYWAVMKPFRYQAMMTRKRAVLMIIGVWILAALVSFIPVMTNAHRADDVDSLLADPPQCEFKLNGIYATVSSSISFYIPSTIILIIYYRIYQTARRIEKQIKQQERTLNIKHKHSRSFGERKAIKTFGLIIGIFVICWLPFFVANCIISFCDQCVPLDCYIAFTWLGWVNSTLNPVIYATNRDFRRAFRQLLCCGRPSPPGRQWDYFSECSPSEIRRASRNRSTTNGASTVKISVTNTTTIDLAQHCERIEMTSDV